MRGRPARELGHELLIKASWQRCDSYGLTPELAPQDAQASRGDINALQQQHHYLIDTTDHEVLPYYENILANSSCLIMLADQQGQVLNCWGDKRFIDRGKRHSFNEGANWSEPINGTNAIGTALATGQPVQVQRDEHYLKANRFMIGSAAPIYDTNRELLAVLDVSSDAYLPQAHTLGMVKMMSQSVENRLIVSKYGNQDFLLTFNTNVDNIDSQWAGLIAFSENGTIISANRRAEMLLRHELALTSVEEIFGVALFDLKNHPEAEPLAVLALGKYQMVASVKRPTQGYSMAPDFRQQRQQPTPFKGATVEQISFGDPQAERAVRMGSKLIAKQMPMLISGQSGVGKTTLARALHHASPRQMTPFISVNCAAMDADALALELFGKEQQPGKLISASGGTLLLDELIALPMPIQGQLLQVIDEGICTPLGSTKSSKLDLQWLCTDHGQLAEAVEQGKFRQDLYFRLSGLKLTLPALQQRKDIKPLINYLHQLHRSAEQAEDISEDALALLIRYPWPGNIRQLDNAIQTALALAELDIIEPWHLPDEVFSASFEQPSQNSAALDTNSQTLHFYNLHHGNISRTAQALGVSRNTLYKRLKELGIKS